MSARLYVRGLKASAKGPALMMELVMAGLNVDRVDLALDAVTRGCRGFGWVTVDGAEPDEALAVARKAAPRLEFEIARSTGRAGSPGGTTRTG